MTQEQSSSEPFDSAPDLIGGPVEPTPETPQEEVQEHPLAGLKVVVEVLDVGSALIGISQGSVDPHLENCAISINDDLSSILAVVPEVLERARERWGRQPRFPGAQPTPAPARTAGQQAPASARTGGQARPQGPQVETPRMF
jgi:hypothetical protein